LGNALVMALTNPCQSFVGFLNIGISAAPAKSSSATAPMGAVMSKVDSIEEHERARFSARAPSLISRDEIRDPAEYRMLYVLGLGALKR
jgi:hypothetical protein